MDQSVQAHLPTKNRKEYTGIPARLIKLLGNGIMEIEAARACGCDPSFISQLKKEPDFVEQINDLVSKNFAEQSKIDHNYVEIERKLSERLLKSADMMFGDDKILRTLKFVNEAKRKVPSAFGSMNGANGDGNSINGHVALIVPIVVAKEFILNPLNEIVGINNQPLATLPPSKLPTLVAKHKENMNREQQEKKQGFKILPNGSRTEDPWGNL